MAACLTDALVQNLKPTRGQTGWREVADGGCRGLCLRISPSGEKVWAIRATVAGKRQRHTLGGYPTVGLGEARNRAKEYRSAGRDGMRPEEIAAKRKAATMTVAGAHAEYVAAREADWRPHTKRLKRGMFAHHIEPQMGSRLIGSIRRLDIVEVGEAVTAKGKAKGARDSFATQVNRVYSEIMAFLRWCEHKGYIDGVPSLRRKDMQKVGAAKERPRNRTLTDTEIAALWKQVAGMGDLTRDFARLLLLTGQRLSEVREMAWEEIDFGQALWVIPGSRYKTRQDHSVPLSEPVLRILRPRWSEGAKGFVLAGTKEGQAFNGHASAMKRIRKKFEGRADFTWHDLRRTMRSKLSHLGVEERTAEMTIGHLPQGMVKVYDMHERLKERRAALDKWAEFVERLANSESNVVPFASAMAAGSS